MRLLFVLICLCLPAATRADIALPEPRPGLFIGTTVEALGVAGLGTVIDLRSSDEIGPDNPIAIQARALNLDYVPLPVAGAQDLTPARVEHLRSALDSSRGQVLLFCTDGDRAGALLALMAHQEEGLSRRAALSLGRRAGLSTLEAEVERRMRALR